jgi:hypothetical protein
MPALSYHDYLKKPTTRYTLRLIGHMADLKAGVALPGMITKARVVTECELTEVPARTGSHAASIDNQVR